MFMLLSSARAAPDDASAKTAVAIRRVARDLRFMTCSFAYLFDYGMLLEAISCIAYQVRHGAGRVYAMWNNAACRPVIGRVRGRVVWKNSSSRGGTNRACPPVLHGARLTFPRSPP